MSVVTRIRFRSKAKQARLDRLELQDNQDSRVQPDNQARPVIPVKRARPDKPACRGNKAKPLPVLRDRNATPIREQTP